MKDNKDVVQLEQEMKKCDDLYFQGSSYFADHEYEKAFKCFIEGASYNHAKSQYGVGYCYHYGFAVEKELNKAIEWYTKAARNRHKIASWRLYLIYHDGEMADPRKAEEWLKQAADLGYPDAVELVRKNRINAMDNTIIITQSLPDDIYTKFAKMFAECRVSQDFSALAPYVAEDVVYTHYQGNGLFGKDALVSALNESSRRMYRQGEFDSISVELCTYTGHAAVVEKIVGYEKRYVMLFIEGGLIVHILAASCESCSNECQDVIDFYAINDCDKDRQSKWQETNEYGTFGADFYNFTKDYFDEKYHDSNVKTVLADRLDVLRFTDDVYYHHAQAEGSGDVSYFYVKDSDESLGKSILNRSLLFLAMEAEATPMAVWQIYLLNHSSNVMDCYWHGGYNMREFIFSVSDLEKIEQLNTRLISIITRMHDVLPKIIIDGEEAVVECCYWSPWKGLVKEKVRYSLDDAGIPWIIEESSEVLYAYDCGICF